MSGAADEGRIEALRAKLDRERAKVRKLVESQGRLAAERSAWLAERSALERRLAVLESHQRLLQGAPTRQGPAAPPLRVLAADRVRKTIFEFVRGAVISSDPSSGDFDVLVISRPEKQDLERLAQSIPETIWSAVRGGRTRLVLDGSSEGHLHRVVLQRFRALAARTGVPLDQVVYLTQDRLASRRQAAAGVHGDAAPPVLNYDYYLHKALRPLLKHGQAAFETRLERYLQAPRRGRRAFLSLNLAPRAHRVLLLARLLRDGLWDKAFISFGGFGPAAPREAGGGELRGLIDWRGMEAAAEEAEPWLSDLHRKGVALFGIPGGVGAYEAARDMLQAGDLPEYRGSWFSVVTETEMRGDTLRVTEKVLKPVLNFHPFVVMGNPGALQLVRSYGLQTFPELFDESYDAEEESLRRFELVYDQVRRLARLDEAELDQLEASVAEKIVFNARLGLTGLPRLFQETLLPAAIALLMPSGGP